MSQMLQIRHKGLFTSPNEFSSVPEGAMLTANNVVIGVDNIVESRRGNNRVYTLPIVTDRISRFTVFQDVLMANWTDGKVGYLSGSAFVAVSGTYSHPNANTARLRFLGASNNLYFPTSAGVYKMDAYNATPSLSGVPRGLDLQVSLSGATGFLATANQAAYRIVWGIRDAANNILKGSPSGRAIIINASGGTRDVLLTSTIPSGITATHFYQVYRSKKSGGVGIEPDDELGLIYENNPGAGATVTATTANGSAVLTGVSSTIQCRVGVSITGAGIPALTTIVSWTATTITMSANATASAAVSVVIGSELTLGTITFTDRTDDDLRGETIYTAPSQEGIDQANERAPQADYIEEFAGCVIYANCKSKHRKIFTILGCGGTSGVQYNDVLTIAGTAYTAKGTETISAREFALHADFTTTATTTVGSPVLTVVTSTAGCEIGRDITGTGIPASTTILSFTASTITMSANATAAGTVSVTVSTGGTAAQNIYDTAESLVRVINRNTTNTTVYSYYISYPNDLPGKILIEERAIGGSAFTLQLTTGSTGGAYNPNLASAVSSLNDDLQNQLMIAKTEEAESVPLINTRRVGSANTAILGVKKLRNSLFIWKEREGIYRMTGTEPGNFEVDLFDSSAKLLSPDSIDVVNNQIWCLCDQGITVVTETGASVISRPIEDLILDQFGSALNQVKYYSFGVGYETERQYILWTVSSSADTYATQAFVFNAFTQSYTRWPLSKTTAIVNPVDDKLYMADGASYYTEQERKSRTYADYIDYGTSYTITSASGTLIGITNTTGIEVGDLLYESATVQSRITAVTPFTVTVENQLTWAIAAATVYKGINCVVEYAAVTGANPGISKRFPEISMLFRAARFTTATLSFSTDVSTSYEDVTISGSGTALWGLFPWALAPWGGTANTVPIRTLVPLEKQRGSLLRVRFTHRQGYGYFKLYGFSLPIIDTGSYQIAK